MEPKPALFIEAAFVLLFFLLLFIAQSITPARADTTVATLPTTSAAVPTVPTVPTTTSAATASRELAITIVMGDAKNGTLDISIAFPRMNAGKHVFTQMVADKEIAFSDMSFKDEFGKPLAFEKNGLEYRVATDAASVIVSSYKAHPGGLGRHGHQGFATESWSSFDGRVFLFGEHSAEIENIRIRLFMPPTWKVASSWETTESAGASIARDCRTAELVYSSAAAGSSASSGPDSPGLASLNLLKSPFAFGELDETTRKFGSTEVSVYTYSRWPAEHKKTITEKSFRLYNYFFERLGFDPSGRYTITWTPKAPDNERVFGGIWSSGTCYEMPTDRPRNWELLAHRIGHAMNKYSPTGMLLDGPDSDWFLEAWASYIEIVSTAAVGIAPDESRWNDLYAEYLTVSRSKSDYDTPIAEENASSGDAREFLHYVKAPLIAKALDHELRIRSASTNDGASRSLEDFVKFAYARHRGQSSTFLVKHELEEFASCSFEEFWRQKIRARGFLVPTWPEYLKTLPAVSANVSASEAGIKPVVLGIEGSTEALIDIRQVFDALYFGEFHSPAELSKFFASEKATRSKLRDAGNAPLADALNDSIEKFSPSARVNLMLAEKERAPSFFDSRASLKPDATDWRGKMLAELFADEQKYDTSRAGSLVDNLVFMRYKEAGTSGDRSHRFTFAPPDQIAAYTYWNIGGIEAIFELIAPDGTIAETKKISVKPDWLYTYSYFKTSRKNKPGVWKIRVSSEKGNRQLIERSFISAPPDEKVKVE